MMKMLSKFSNYLKYFQNDQNTLKSTKYAQMILNDQNIVQNLKNGQNAFCNL